VPLQTLTIAGVTSGPLNFMPNVTEYTVVTSLNLASARAFALSATFVQGAELFVLLDGSEQALASGETWKPDHNVSIVSLFVHQQRVIHSMLW